MIDEHAHCPHCRQLLLANAPHPFPERAVRCTGCRLLVGPGRSRDAQGRARRLVPSRAAAPRADAVLGVLQDLQGQTLDVELRAAGAALTER